MGVPCFVALSGLASQEGRSQWYGGARRTEVRTGPGAREACDGPGRTRGADAQRRRVGVLRPDHRAAKPRNPPV